MGIKLSRPSTPAVLATIALIAASAGGAYAAIKIDTKQIAKKAVTAKKIAGKAVTTGKLADAAVTGAKLGGAAVTTDTLADESVTTPKLAPGERSEAFIANVPGTIPLPSNVATEVARLTLPADATYLVNATTTLGSGSGATSFISCELRDDGSPVAQGSEGTPPVAAFAASVTVQAASDGGVVTLLCSPSINSAARDRVITATRVGNLQTQ
jgi:hypothetical protein